MKTVCSVKFHDLLIHSPKCQQIYLYYGHAYSYQVAQFGLLANSMLLHPDLYMHRLSQGLLLNWKKLAQSVLSLCYMMKQVWKESVLP